MAAGRRGKWAQVGRLGQQLELGQAAAAVTVRGAGAVAARVAAADDDDVFARGQNLVGQRCLPG